MSVCSGITASITIDCTNPPVAGVSDIMYLINRDDIDAITFDTANPNAPNKLVTNITLKTGKYIYKVEGRNNSHEPTTTLRKGRYFDSYEHQVSFKIFSNGPEVKSEIESMVQKGNMLAIVENNYRGAAEKATFELYGYTSGLEVAEGSRNANDNDTQGSYALVLKTPEQQGESHLPFSFLVTDYAGTKAWFEANVAVV